MVWCNVVWYGIVWHGMVRCEALEEPGWRDVVTHHQPSGASIGRG